jgi:hypothetical protein
MVNRRQVIKSGAAAATVLVMPKYAFAASAFTGFYPAGNWIAAKQPMIQVYPRPDSETNTWARHRWAYYDGANPVQYKIPLGVSFGAFPYVYTLQSGPPGMTIGATYWNPAWTSFQDAQAAGYGYLLWTPTASVSGATVSVLVTDQQMNTLTITFTVSTSSSTSKFIFVDAVNGSDTSGTGTISAPWQTYTKAFGATASTNVNANALCYFRAGTYTLPAQTVVSGVTITQVNTSIKPSALMGFPGDTPPIFSMTNCFFSDNGSPSTDLFVQGLNPNDYTHSIYNMRWFWLNTGGTKRVTFEGNNWTNSGYGSSAPSNTPMFFMDFTQGQAKYIFVKNNSEERVTSGHEGNNIVGFDSYYVDRALVEGNTSISPTITVDGCWVFKSDITNSCMRGNFASFYDCAYGLGSTLQDPLAGTFNIETCYNRSLLGIQAANGSSGPFFPINSPGTVSHPMTNQWCYRNSVTGNIGSNSPNEGSISIQSNAVQYQYAPAIVSGSAVTSSGNVTATSGLLDSNGNLTSAYSSYRGTVGAEIALASSSAATPNAPTLKVS